MKQMILIGFCMILFTGLVHANGIFKGIVTDRSTGMPLKGVTVTIKSKQDSNRILKAVTGDDGKFIFRNVANGTYETSVNYLDFNQKQDDILLTDAKPVVLNVDIPQDGTNGLMEISVSR